MLYSIIDAKLGEEKCFLPLTHRTLKKGELMVVNENELRKLGDDITAEARKLGGSIMTHSELLNKIRKLKS